MLGGQRTGAIQSFATLLDAAIIYKHFHFQTVISGCPRNSLNQNLDVPDIVTAAQISRDSPLGHKNEPKKGNYSRRFLNQNSDVPDIADIDRNLNRDKAKSRAGVEVVGDGFHHSAGRPKKCPIQTPNICPLANVFIAKLSLTMGMRPYMSPQFSTAPLLVPQSGPPGFRAEHIHTCTGSLTPENSAAARDLAAPDVAFPTI